jgi:hypothetical protein
VLTAQINKDNSFRSVQKRQLGKDDRRKYHGKQEHADYLVAVLEDYRKGVPHVERLRLGMTDLSGGRPCRQGRQRLSCLR